MKIGIVGPADRAVAWEKHLRPHHSVSEVVIAKRHKDIGDVTACLLLDDSEEQLKTLLKLVHSGIHTFLISKLPTNLTDVEKIYHAAEEANVLLQFSHWPSLAPDSQWMVHRVPKPTFIQTVREINLNEHLEAKYNLEFYWIDELAYCLKWINGAVHHVDLKTVELGHNTYALHLFLRFDSGATSNIYINAGSAENRHQRVASNNTYLLECNVLTQTVRMGQENPNGHLYFEKQTFDATKSAELAVTHFLKSIQMKKPTLYSGYDLMRLNREVVKIRNRIARV